MSLDEAYRVITVALTNLKFLTFNFYLHGDQWREIWRIKSIKASSTHFSGTVSPIQTSSKIQSHLM